MPSLYPIEIRNSQIEGRGVFALEDIPKGTVYWVWETNQTLICEGCEIKPNKAHTQSDLLAIANTDAQKLRDIFNGGYYYAYKDVFIQLADGFQYCNHSTNPNSRIYIDLSLDPTKQIAITTKDIKKGDQITQFYGDYLSKQSPWLIDLMQKYLSKRSTFESTITA